MMRFAKINIYLIAAPEVGLVKVGISRDPSQRFHSLQGANAVELCMMKTWLLDFDLGRTVEQYAHAGLRDYWVRGEWFSADVDWAINTIEMAIILISARHNKVCNLVPFLAKHFRRQRMEML